MAKNNKGTFSRPRPYALRSAARQRAPAPAPVPPVPAPVAPVPAPVAPVPAPVAPVPAPMAPVPASPLQGPMRLRSGTVLQPPPPPQPRPPQQFSLQGCFATTKAGTLCRRRHRPNKLYCWQHQKMFEEGRLPPVPQTPALQPVVRLTPLQGQYAVPMDQGQPEAGPSNQSDTDSLEETAAVTIEDILAREGRIFNEIAKDGNCFFRSLSLQLDGHQENHGYYRELIVDFIREHSDTFKDWYMPTDMNVETYLERMGKNSTYATDCEVAAAATLFQKPFYVLWPDNHGHYRWHFSMEIPRQCPAVFADDFDNQLTVN